MKAWLKVMTTASLLATAGMAHAQDSIRIAYSTGSFAFMPFFATEALGFFDEAGVNVELLKVGSGSKTMAAVAGRAADLSVGSSGTNLYARKEGLDLQIFATLVDQYSTGITMSGPWAEQHGVNEDSPLEAKLASLKGARIATSGPGGGDHIIRYLSQLAGLDPDRDLTIIHLGNDIGVYAAAIKEGRIDAFALSEPAGHAAKKEAGAVVVFDLARGQVAELDGFPYITVQGRQEWLEANPEIVKKVYSAFAKTATALTDGVNTEAERDAVRAAFYADTDADLFSQIWDSAILSIPETPLTEPEDVARIAEFLNLFEENKIDVADLEGASTTAYATE